MTDSHNAEKLRRRMLSRRQFLDAGARNAAGVAAMGVGVVGLTSSASESEVSPLRVAVVGIRNQGKQLARAFAALPGCRVSHLCDIDRNLFPTIASAIAQEQGAEPRLVDDYRRLLDDDDLDAVVVATPDHWHFPIAADALAAGKHLSLETPVTHTLDESLKLLQLSESVPDRIVQCGLSHRSSAHFQSAIAFLQSGELGPVRLAKAWTTHRRRSIGTSLETPVPEGVDYATWLGPVGERPFHANRFHYHWRWFWEFGSGELGNWGVPLLDVARWGLGVETPSRVSSVGGKFHFDDEQETPDTQQVLYDFGNATITWEHRQWSHHGNEGRSAGVAFYGERGTLIVDRGGWKIYGLKDGPSQEGRDDLSAHCANFLHAIRTQTPPVADLTAGHLASQLCHLGNQAHREGREVVVRES